ncbi:serine/threonine protein kinase [Ahniella affigens]|nr:serine/threonine-protein kinase [Ahniella affigens]
MVLTATEPGSEPRLKSDLLARQLGVLGPYVLQAIIGEGGMGAVYLAEQTEPVQRKVAIKVTRVDLSSGHRLARFESERQILATLKHPNVAQVFDAGDTSEGFPYLVMEFIDGLPIDAFADQQHWSVAARVNVFLQACAAVMYAHQHGVIHRDLKPANLLVENIGQTPTLKLIDFGIAKLAAPVPGSQTETGRTVGTPAYMSPEQAEGDADIDTRTDVYALGMTLCKLLTGLLPMSAWSAKSAREGHVSDHQEVMPSALLIGGPDAPVAGYPAGTRLRDLRAALRGDLDWIVMKATDPDRSRRYASVSELSDDLKRYLQQEPVLAAPPGWFYRIGKFLRRYRWQVASVMALMLTVATAAVLLVRSLQQERAALELANMQLRQHEDFNAYAAHVIGSVQPSTPGSAINLDDILRFAKDDAAVYFKDRPQTAFAVSLLVDQLVRRAHANRASASPAPATSAQPECLPATDSPADD